MQISIENLAMKSLRDSASMIYATTHFHSRHLGPYAQKSKPSLKLGSFKRKLNYR